MKISIEKQEPAVKLFNEGKNIMEVAKVLNIDITDYETERSLVFFSRISIDENGCWNWTGRLDKGDYGIFYCRGSWAAHRFIMGGDDVPKEMIVHHECLNSKCVNPVHLKIVTHQENVQDAINKKLLGSVGETNPYAKLKNIDILDIVEKYRNNMIRGDIAKIYNVCTATITKILIGETWKHIDREIFNIEKQKGPNPGFRKPKLDYNEFLKIEMTEEEMIRYINVDYKTIEGNKYLKLRVKFLNNIIINSETGCWEFKNALGTKFYGRFWFGDRSYRAHRVSLEIYLKEKIPNDKIACHHCDNGRCSNPHHLYLGTTSDNACDVIKRGRRKIVSKTTDEDKEKIRMLYREGESTCKLGEIFNVCSSTIGKIVKSCKKEKEFANAKLTEKIAKEILKKRKTESISITILAKEYKVSISTIYELITGKSWKHLPR